MPLYLFTYASLGEFGASPNPRGNVDVNINTQQSESTTMFKHTHTHTHSSGRASAAVDVLTHLHMETETKTEAEERHRPNINTTHAALQPSPHTHTHTHSVAAKIALTRSRFRLQGSSVHTVDGPVWAWSKLVQRGTGDERRSRKQEWGGFQRALVPPTLLGIRVSCSPGFSGSWQTQGQINTAAHDSCAPHTPKTIAGGPSAAELTVCTQNEAPDITTGGGGSFRAGWRGGKKSWLLSS